VFKEFAPTLNVAIFSAAAILVWMAGTRLARLADQIGETTGLGRELLGLLLLGGVTSLPELSVGVSATLAGAPELSVNDVLGSASVNVVILAAADAVYGRRALTSAPGAPGVLLPGALSILLLSLRTAAAGSAILVAGFLLAQSGEALAEQTGLGTSFFGAALLALSTSLPEVSTVLAAARLRRYEMAMADVFGTNLFNVTIIVLVDALHPGDPVLLEAGRFASFGALLAIVLTAVFLVGVIERRDRTVFRMGIDSLFAIACYAGGLVVLYQLR
jgi:Ca2+/Na+ antiporter